MTQIKNIEPGNYLFHISVLKEAAESWIKKRQKSNAGAVFLHLLAKASKSDDIQIYVCDRSLRELKNSKESISYHPGMISCLNPAQAIMFDHLKGDHYFLKVASRINAKPAPFTAIVSNQQHQNLEDLAYDNKYKLNLKKVDNFIA